MQRDGLGLIGIDHRIAITDLLRHIQPAYIEVHKPLGASAGTIELELLPLRRIGLRYIHAADSQCMCRSSQGAGQNERGQSCGKSFLHVLSFLKIVVTECFIGNGSTPERCRSRYSSNEAPITFTTWFSFAPTLNRKAGHANMTGLPVVSVRSV